MEQTRVQVDFFMGGDAPGGFSSYFDELCRPEPGKRCYLVKGGPGVGKSTLLKRAAAAAKDRLSERIHCASDPDSLDGVILHDTGCCLLDATPPHAVEPAFPGGFETMVDLSGQLSEEVLEARLPELVETAAACGALHRKCRSLLQCAALLEQESGSIVESCTDFRKLTDFACRLADRRFRPVGGYGQERRRLLTGITPNGILSYPDTVTALCDRVLLLEDPYGVASGFLLALLKTCALERGYTVYGCYDPLFPRSRLLAILIPKLRFGIAAEGARYPTLGVKPTQVIHFTRFTDKERLREKRQLLRFQKRASEALLGAAVDRLAEALRLHDRLESRYREAVDFAGVERITEGLLARLAARAADADGVEKSEE